MKRLIRLPSALPRLLLILIVALGHVALNAPIVAAASENFLDNFDTIWYGNNDGTLSWEGPWSEVGEVSDPETGDWTITTDTGFPGHVLKKSGNDGIGIVRTADLEGFSSVTLHFSYRRERLALGKSISVQISSSGSDGPWTTIDTIGGAAPEATDPTYQPVSIDITAYASESTSVRFMHEGAGAFGAFMAVYLDDVEITGEQTNRAPVLEAVGSLVVDESSELRFAASATDPDGDGLVFTLAGDVPAGASITPDGVFSWVPDESQGPGSYRFDVIVADTGSPVLTHSQNVDVTVNEVNQAPVLTSPGDQLDGEGSSVSLNLKATDHDLPANGLTWQGSGLPPGLAIGFDGVITGTVDPSAAAGSPYEVTTQVADDNGLTDQTTFTWTITDMNRAPVLEAVGSLVVDESSELRFAASATDPDGDGLVFTLAGDVPAGASITPDGVFSWVPDESQGPGSYRFDVIVADTGSPVLTHSQNVDVTVNEVNQAPVLTSPGDQLDGEGSSVSLNLKATDHDLPANGLTWQGSGLPPGLAIGFDGVITGTVDPSAAAGSPYEVTTQVADDNGLTDQTTFTWTITGAPLVSAAPQGPPVEPSPAEDQDDGDEIPTTTSPGEKSGGDGASTPESDGPRQVTANTIPLSDQEPPSEVESLHLASQPMIGMSAAVSRLLEAVGLTIPTTLELDGVEEPPLLRAVTLFTKAFFHTILAMDIPTLLLGFAAITLVGLRGVSRYPVLFNRRSQHYWAVVMLGRERRLAVYERPDANSKVIYKLGPTTQSVRGTGAETSAEGTRWVGVSTAAGEGWVDGSKVTEQVDAKSFMNDARARRMLEEFLDRLRSKRDVADLISERGLVLVLAEMTQNLDKKVLGRLVTDPTDTQILTGGWSPRDFHQAVVEPLLEAYDHRPVISPHVAHAETSLLPTPMRNFRYLALGGPGAQSWLVFFEYFGGKPKIIGLTIDE